MGNRELAIRISRQLAQDIQSGVLPAGSHIGTQQIASRYQVSRTPVREALIALEQVGVLSHMPNRGYFVSKHVPQAAIERITAEPMEDAGDYQQMAEDWLTDRLPEIVTEQALRQRYGLTKSRVGDLLARAAREGWAEPKAGYGWRLLPVAKTTQAFDEIYRFRMAIEPAAMLEPGFRVDRAVLQAHQRTQSWMLEADVSRTSNEQLLANGSSFHEDLMRMSHNPFFVSALERVNRMRRLLEYRARVDRARLTEQCSEHLEMIDLLMRGEIVEASYFMRRHLAGALKRKAPIAWHWQANAKVAE